MMLSEVWRLSRTSGLSRDQRGLRKTKIGTKVAHVTRDRGHHFQGQQVKGHQAALLTAALTRQVSVGTYWPWERTATSTGAARLRSASARRRKALRRPEGGEGRGILWRLPHSLLTLKKSSCMRIGARHEKVCSNEWQGA